MWIHVRADRPTAPPAPTTRLTDVLSAYDVDLSHLAVAADPNRLLEETLRAVCDPGDKVVFTAPSSGAYAARAAAAAAVPDPVPAYGDRQELDAMLGAGAGGGARVVIVANPHVPTNSAPDAGELEDFLDGMPSHVLIVLDETAAGPQQPTAMRLTPGRADRENLAVLRTDGHGSYLAGAPQLAAAVRGGLATH
jgi:histidinol-phosphate aminotransferase